MVVPEPKGYDRASELRAHRQRDVSPCFAPSILITSPLGVLYTPSRVSPLSMRSVSGQRKRSHWLRGPLPIPAMDHQLEVSSATAVVPPHPAPSRLAGSAPRSDALKAKRAPRRGTTTAGSACWAIPSAIRPWRRPTRPLAHPLQPLGTIWRLYRSSHLDVKLLRAVSTALSSSEVETSV